MLKRDVALVRNSYFFKLYSEKSIFFFLPKKIVIIVKQKCSNA